MKILTKILNILLVVFVISGIVFPILYFNSIKVNKNQYEQLTSANDSLNTFIKKEESIKKILKDSLIIKDAEINHHKERISELKMENANLQKKLEDRLDELSDMNLEEILNLLREYYDTDSTEIKIATHDSIITVSVQPRLIRLWANDFTMLESKTTEILGYQKQVSEYELLVYDYESKIDLQDSINVVNENIIKKEREKNTNFQNIIDNRNKKIKSLKIQRNAAGVIVAIVIILAIL